MASPKVLAHAHHLAGAAHLGAEDGVDARELVEGEHRFLDAEVRRHHLVRRRPPRPVCSASFWPAMQRAAILASCWPVALLT
jgi:hypothetical protein